MTALSFPTTGMAIPLDNECSLERSSFPSRPVSASKADNRELRAIGPSESDKLSRVTFSDIGTEKKPLRWVNVHPPNAKLLASIGKTIGVSDGTMELVLRGEAHPTYFRNREACLFALPELRFDPKTAKLHSETLYAIITKDHLVTISQRPSELENQVQAEMKRGALSELEKASSNYLLTRILGCSIHRNETELKKLSQFCADFAAREAHELPCDKARALLRVVTHSIEQAQAAVTPTLEIIHALREEESLFGMNKPKDALNRYQALMGLLNSHVVVSQNHAKQIPLDWDLNQDEDQNRYQSRLNTLAALIGPPSLAASLIQAMGNDWAQPRKWLIMGVSLAVSAALLVGMRVGASAARRIRGAAPEPDGFEKSIVTTAL